MQLISIFTRSEILSGLNWMPAALDLYRHPERLLAGDALVDEATVKCLFRIAEARSRAWFDALASHLEP